ncbi:VOC family protein [Evansella halocellulosilytica]|uniref:VOC family protein n=1 Tax=Evansella halocellulosilytica TaxID=2011013 RepID=UPI000BB68FF3|nr:VOC family protein [Evansella halocellulosilytica]
MTFQIHEDTQLGEVKLKVSNIEKSSQFYKEIIGFRILEKKRDSVTLTADGNKSLLVLKEVPNAVVLPPRSATGLYHFAILLPERKDLGNVYEHLLQHNIRLGSSDHYVSEAIYLSDPDGNGIELYHDRPRDHWLKDEHGNYIMTVDPLNENSLLEAGGGEQWERLPENTKIGHIHLHVNDLHQSRKFYKDVLGFDTTVENDKRMGMLFHGAGGYHHHIGLNIWAGADAPNPPERAVGIARYTIVLPNEDAFENVRKNINTYHYQYEIQERSLFITDPAQVNIQLTVKEK